LSREREEDEGAGAAGERSGPGGSLLRVRTVEILAGEVVLIDQLALPQEERYVHCRTWREVADRIADMTVRGAPAIGVTAAGGIALAAAEAAAAPGDATALRAALEQAAGGLLATRPTAVNLRWALDEMRRAWETALAADGPQAAPAGVAAVLLARAQAIHDDDVDRCLRIGEHGAALFGAGDRILTHCNAGALATAGYGTALGVIRTAAARYPDISVWVDETRPWLQGARLTAWELQRDGIPVTVLTDNMAGWLMSRGEISCVVVGADRIAANGDVANKIGTYSLAVLARHHAIPFYVAAPWSTFDTSLATGAGIPIEERPSDEVVRIFGKLVAPEGVPARYPAFDVTPADLVTAIVTERGVLRAPFGPAIGALAG
jgi:methylthioribose-1-phosphate isomerase